MANTARVYFDAALKGIVIEVVDETGARAAGFGRVVMKLGDLGEHDAQFRELCLKDTDGVTDRTIKVLASELYDT